MAPISQQERAQLISAGFGVAEAATGLGISTLGTASFAPAGLTVTASAPFAVPLLAFIPPALGLLSLALRPRFPRLEPADIGRTVQEIQRLERQGLQPIVGTDPFTGNVAIATADQLRFLPQLLQEAAERARPLPPTQPLFSLREELIGSLAESAVERGFFRRTEDIPRGLTGQFIRPAAEAPLRFVPLSPGAAA